VIKSHGVAQSNILHVN